MKNIDTIIAEAEEKAFETTMLVGVTGGRRVAFREFLRQTIRTAVERAFEATAPVKYPENLIEGRAESKSGWAMRQANAVVDELRTKQAEFLAPLPDSESSMKANPTEQKCCHRCEDNVYDSVLNMHVDCCSDALCKCHTPPPTPEQKMREEFCFTMGIHSDERGRISENTKDKIADWWLSKLHTLTTQAREDERERVRGEVEKIYREGQGSNPFPTEGGEAIRSVLALLTPTKPDYEHYSHAHCWNNPKLPCGIPLERHTQCCLCDLEPESGAITH